MRTGSKAQGQEGFAKLAIPRHTHTFSKSSAHRCEKAVETHVRQSGRRACRLGAQG